jgi:cytochrome c oxidase subunit 4
MADEQRVHAEPNVRGYWIVFGALLLGTALTVFAAYWLHLPTAPAVAVALLIASFKGSLVALFFMHLISERKLIYVVLVFTALFFLALLLGPYLTNLDAVSL